MAPRNYKMNARAESALETRERIVRATLELHLQQGVLATSHKDIAVVEFTENKILDEMSVSEIERALTTLLESRQRPKILLDFSNVDHLTSAALGMLININNRIKQQNGQLRLANIRPQIMEVFMITKLNRLFRILGTRADALANFE